MDPNVTLRELRESANDILDHGEIDEALAFAFALKFQALDDWLRKGGFLPKDWDNRPKPPMP